MSEFDKKLEAHKKRQKLYHERFMDFGIRDTCTFGGNIWDQDEMYYLPCGEPTVGNGLFCTPEHGHCMIYSLCARHANRPIENWNDNKKDNSHRKSLVL